MAERLCFFVNNKNEIEEKYVSFDYVKGMAFSQKIKCAQSLQNAIKAKYPGCKSIEISSKSSIELGRSLSAFNLKLDKYFVESVFQSSKVFVGIGQFEFLKDSSPLEAKKYVRENGNNHLICFKYNGVEYPLNPKSAFYDWIYINALNKSKWKDEILEYDVFSDIEFNDKKSINCQARAVAIYVSIRRNGKCDYYLSAFEKFIELYKENISGQMSLFDL